MSTVKEWSPHESIKVARTKATNPGHDHTIMISSGMLRGMLQAFDEFAEQSRKNRIAAVQVAGYRPEIVCLCGSMRYMDAYRQAEYDLEMQGVVVLAPSFLPGAEKHDGTTGCTPEQKIMLDTLHKRKIDMADSILVITNVAMYIGESTRSEIYYAEAHGKPVRFWDGTGPLVWRGTEG